MWPPGDGQSSRQDAGFTRRLTTPPLGRPVNARITSGVSCPGILVAIAALVLEPCQAVSFGVAAKRADFAVLPGVDAAVLMTSPNKVSKTAFREPGVSTRLSFVPEHCRYGMPLSYSSPSHSPARRPTGELPELIGALKVAREAERLEGAGV